LRIPLLQNFLPILNPLITLAMIVLLAALFFRSLRQRMSGQSASSAKIKFRDTPAAQVMLTLWQHTRRIVHAIRKCPLFTILDLKSRDHGSTLREVLPGYLLCGGLLIYAGQAMLPVPPEAEQWVGWVYIAAGSYLFFAAAYGFSRSRFPAVLAAPFRWAAGWFGISALQFMLLACALPLSLAASRLAGIQPLMHQAGPAAAAWLLAVLSLFLGSMAPGRQGEKTIIPRWEIAAVAVVFLGGCAARMVNLENLPWLLTGDEGSAGLSAIRFIEGGQNNLFSTGWFSFPSLFYFLQSLPIRLLGRTITALRLSSAIIGSLTVLATWWALRPVFGRWTALFAAAYMATFHFHIHFSRIGLNNIWDSFFFVVAFGAAMRFLQQRRLTHAVLAGVAIGLCQYFYSSSKTLIVLIVVWLLLMLVFQRRQLHGTGQGVVLLLFALVVVVLPLALYYIDVPNDFTAPYNRVTLLPDDQSLFTQEGLAKALPEIKIQLLASIKAFTATNLRFWYNIDHPMLLTLPAALFLMGLALMLLKLSDPAVMWMLLWLASSVGISMFSQDAPAAQRFPYTAPVVAAILAMPLHQVYAWLSSLWPRFQRWILAGVSLLLLLAVSSDIGFYFFEYSSERNFGDVNTEVAHEAAHYLKDKPEDTLVYFLGGRMGYYSHSSIQYLAPQCTGIDLFETVDDPPEISTYLETVFIILPEREEEVAALLSFFPDGEERLFYDKNENVLFISYLVPPSHLKP